MFKRKRGWAISWQKLVIIIAALILGLLFLAIVWRLQSGVSP
jgi:hypothetical protein